MREPGKSNSTTVRNTTVVRIPARPHFDVMLEALRGVTFLKVRHVARKKIRYIRHLIISNKH
jgi:ribosomal protein L19